jgi:hypothetical protein
MGMTQIVKTQLFERYTFADAGNGRGDGGVTNRKDVAGVL